MSETISDPQIRPDVLSADDVMNLVPRLRKHPKLVDRLLHWLAVDKVNNVHRRFLSTPGPEFAQHLLFDELNINLEVEGAEVLDSLPEGAFITVSNHPFGALDGVALIYLIASRRPDFKVMVNMILNKIGALRQNFIAVDAMASNDPEKRKVSVQGIFETLRRLKEGHPVGFFPAGAMSTIDRHYKLVDRPWQPTVLQIIDKAKVPVIPIYFHGYNSVMFNLLGKFCWPLRTMRLPSEVWRKKGKTIRVSIGAPISVEQQRLHASTPEELGQYLREQTYILAKPN